MMESRRVLWKYFIVCEDDESKNACLTCLRLAFVFFFPSTTIRIRIRPNTAVNYSVFGQILKNP